MRKGSDSERPASRSQETKSVIPTGALILSDVGDSGSGSGSNDGSCDPPAIPSSENMEAVKAAARLGNQPSRMGIGVVEASGEEGEDDAEEESEGGEGETGEEEQERGGREKRGGRANEIEPFAMETRRSVATAGRFSLQSGLRYDSQSVNRKETHVRRRDEGKPKGNIFRAWGEAGEGEARPSAGEAAEGRRGQSGGRVEGRKAQVGDGSDSSEESRNSYYPYDQGLLEVRS